MACTEYSKSFWVFDQGKWGHREGSLVERPQPAQSRADLQCVMGLVLPNREAAWYLLEHQPLARLPLASVKPVAANRLQSLVNALKDNSFQVRRDASQELEKMGPSIKPDLEKALAQATDPEQQASLRGLIKMMSVRKPAAEVETGFGSVRIAGCRQLYEDGTGRVFVVAGKIDRDLPGVAIMDRDGKVTGAPRPAIRRRMGPAHAHRQQLAGRDADPLRVGRPGVARLPPDRRAAQAPRPEEEGLRRTASPSHLQSAPGGGWRRAGLCVGGNADQFGQAGLGLHAGRRRDGDHAPRHARRRDVSVISP